MMSRKFGEMTCKYSMLIKSGQPGHAPLAKGGWDRTERTKKRQRRGPATAPPCCVCVREPNHTRKPKPKDNQHHNQNISPRSRSKRFPLLLGILLPGQSYSRLLLPLEWNRKTLVLLCFAGCAAAALALGDFWVQSELRDQKCDGPETQEQFF